jgi:hypothetical protein
LADPNAGCGSNAFSPALSQSAEWPHSPACAVPRLAIAVLGAGIPAFPDERHEKNH